MRYQVIWNLLRGKTFLSTLGENIRSQYLDVPRKRNTVFGGEKVISKIQDPFFPQIKESGTSGGMAAAFSGFLEWIQKQFLCSLPIRLCLQQPHITLAINQWETKIA